MQGAGGSRGEAPRLYLTSDGSIISLVDSAGAAAPPPTAQLAGGASSAHMAAAQLLLSQHGSQFMLNPAAGGLLAAQNAVAAAQEALTMQDTSALQQLLHALTGGRAPGASVNLGALPLPSGRQPHLLQLPVAGDVAGTQLYSLQPFPLQAATAVARGASGVASGSASLLQSQAERSSSPHRCAAGCGVGGGHGRYFPFLDGEANTRGGVGRGGSLPVDICPPAGCQRCRPWL